MPSDRPFAIFVIVILLLLAASLTGSRDIKKPDDASRVDAAYVAGKVIAQTNAFRTDERRSEVKPNEKLTATAQYFADFMARTDEYGHEADGHSPGERAKDHGYEFGAIGENIAFHFDSRGPTADELISVFVEGWKNSPHHRENMLDPDMTETGVAIARSAKSGKYYAVQMFGRPVELNIVFSIENKSDAEIEYELAGQKYSIKPRFTIKHTVGRPETVMIHWPGGQKDDSVKPANGEKFTIWRGRSGQYEMRKS